MPDAGKRTRLLLAAAATSAAAAAMGHFGKAPHATGGFLLSYTAAFLPYAWALRLATRGGGAPAFGVVLAVGLLLRLLVFPALPSDDLNRYVWEGRVQREGVNPYLAPPADERLRHLRDESWSGINHPDLPAIYPPGTQLAFRLMAEAGLEPRGVKALMGALDLAVIAALGLLLRARGIPPGHALVYAWNPLAVFQIAGRGHMEPLLLLPLLLAAAALPRAHLPGRAGARALGGALTAAAFMAKWNAAPLMLVWGRTLRAPGLLAAMACALLLAAPYAGAGIELFASPTRFYTDFHYADSLNALAVSALGPAAGRSLCAAALLGIIIFLALRRRDPPASARLFFGALVLLSPSVHPWYLLWVLPWLAVGRPWGWVVLTATVPLYADGLVAAAGGWADVREHGGWKALAYGAGGLVWVVGRARAYRRRNPAGDA